LILNSLVLISSVLTLAPGILEEQVTAASGSSSLKTGAIQPRSQMPLKSVPHAQLPLPFFGHVW
jgi:hypothetical protein